MRSIQKSLCASLVVFLASSGASFAQADLRPDKVYLAEMKKTAAYVKDGLITGGDAAVSEFVVKDIRRAANAGYERVVIDLESNKNGEPMGIDRAPYFQVSVTPDEKRLVFTFFGKPSIGFAAKRILDSFKKSPVIAHLALYPTLEENSWTFSVEMKGGHPVEVFELANPVRVIMDIRNQ